MESEDENADDNGSGDEEWNMQVVGIGLQVVQLMEHQLENKKRFRRWWSKPLIRENYLLGYGGYESVFQYFKLNDEEKFINFTRMNVQSFELIYGLIRERLIRKSNRAPIPSQLRFALTLW